MSRRWGIQLRSASNTKAETTLRLVVALQETSSAAPSARYPLASRGDTKKKVAAGATVTVNERCDPCHRLLDPAAESQLRKRWRRTTTVAYSAPPVSQVAS